MINIGSFDEMVRIATGHLPYPYQRKLAEAGLPEVLRAPTGSGKTVAAVLPWLYRRRFHSDGEVRAATPRRLVVVLPQRSLVEQTARVAGEWLAALGLAGDVKPHVLMGGLGRKDSEWQLEPTRDAIFVGTQDMVMSRLLMRGYAESRASWPISFGLLHCDTQFVFDEVQLMGPALPTSRQLQGLRAALGTAKPCHSMWMSATIDVNALLTVDAPSVDSVVELTSDDRAGALANRLGATRLVRHLDVDPARYATELAAALIEVHEPATRTIAVLNTVKRAGEVFDALMKLKARPSVVLLHSRFRPHDRAVQFAKAIADPGDDGLIVVATQVLEAGVDIDSKVMLTEVAPWSSIVQRAGRCNRSGDHTDAVLLWVQPPGRDAAPPYDPDDVDAAAVALRVLEGTGISSEDLQNLTVIEKPKLHSVLRRRDLLGLFDTMPDLTGNDLDVSRWIRDSDAFSCAAAWRDAVGEGPFDDSTPAPSRDELCPVMVSDLRDWLASGNRGWLFDQTIGEWRRARSSDARAGAVFILAAADGGYDPRRGWWPASRAPVMPVDLGRADPPNAVGDDLETRAGAAVTLAKHLDDVEREAKALFDGFGDLSGITPELRRAAELAARYHDLGKAHEVFADSLASAGTPPEGGPWAKSQTTGRLLHSKPGFRHELVSALMVLEPSSGLLDGVEEPDLVAYLVAAHHGKVRTAVRSLPFETERILGVEKVDSTPEVSFSNGRRVPALTLHRDVLEIGSGSLGDSWQTRACRLRDRLGPFSLAFLEAVVRLADWVASASYKEVV